MFFSDPVSAILSEFHGKVKKYSGKQTPACTQQALIYETNVLNQYTEISQNAAPAAAPEYDDDGNILKYKDKICQWNAENRLVSVEPQNPVSGDRKITFLYDYMGRRVRKQVSVHSGTDWNPAPESEKLFVYEGWNMVKETTVTGGGTSAKYYVWGPDLSQSVQGAGGIGGLLCSSENGTVLYYAYDANGNTGQLVNAADGTIAAHYEYDPFGNTVISYGAYADENPFRFSTKYFDAETGLYYYGFRYYSAELGRWWSRDPVGELGSVILREYGFYDYYPKKDNEINSYLYVKNNMINIFDLYGLSSFLNYYHGAYYYEVDDQFSDALSTSMGYIPFGGFIPDFVEWYFENDNNYRIEIDENEIQKTLEKAVHVFGSLGSLVVGLFMLIM